MSILSEIQAELHAPKGQTNKFGNYNYRSCEDILAAVKPILKEKGATLTISDKIVQKGDRYYVKATAYLHTDTFTIKVSAYAREQETKKGMDEAQITGAASSYARKYALNGLFAIDDTKDADTMDNSEPQHRFKKGEKEKIISDIKECLDHGDDYNLKEVWNNLERDAQLKIWPEFSSTERNTIKQLLGENNGE